ncbi:MAG: AgmX/PglI C-terminal domain-containing protein [Polyangiaceae bacterium]|nr:AgmX/PglI C-terminal domain-containing protein [Polyangiaceae bacterium]
MTQQPAPQTPAPGARPGQMTAVMRAVAATGPKVLRIGVVQGGRVSEERIIKQRTHVTVGPNEKSMFVIASQNVPPSFRLFEMVGNEYWLNFLDGMAGRLALPTGISDLAVLKGQARRSPQGAYQVRLSEDSRGKVVIGDVTFLFQFVAPPPIQPRPQLPVSVTRGASDIDWGTTMIAAFCFLLHFMGIGAIYSDWLDPIIDDEVSVAGLVASVQALPAPPPLETEKETTEVDPNAAKADAKDDKPAAKASGGPQGAGGSKGPAGGLSETKRAAIAAELDTLEMAAIGAMSSQGAATAGVLRGGEVATGTLDAAAASGAGVSAGGDLRLGGGGGAIRPGEAGGGAGLGQLGAAGKTDGTGGTGEVKKVEGPKGSAAVGGAAVSGGNISNAARVVAGMRAAFRACYQRGLNENPDSAGSIRLSIRVGPGGEVQSVSASPSGNLPGSVVGCVRGRAQAASFDPPEGGAGATVVVPVTFVKQ